MNDIIYGSGVMIEKAVILFNEIKEDTKEISFSEILNLCAKNKGLPKNKGDLYFLISSLEAMKVFERLPQKIFKINWKEYHKLKIEGGFNE